MIVLLSACAAAAPSTLHVVDFTLDRGAERALPVRASWADGEAARPIVVFSHGMGGSSEGYAPLVRHWAEEGYLVLQPTHPDSLAFRSRLERLKFARDPSAFVKDPEVVEAWDDRPAEVAAVLDRLDEVLRATGLPAAGVDPEHVGVGGHSFGAHTTMLCAGLSVAGGGSFDEARADAVVLLSPQGTGAGITSGSYANITRPTLVVTGSKDRSVRTGKGPEWRLEAWEGLGAEDRWLLWLEGGTHALGGITGHGPTDADLLSAVLESTTRFWDATLRGQGSARTQLDAGTVTHGGDRVRLTRPPE